MALLDQVLGYVVNQTQASSSAQTPVQIPASAQQSGLPNLSPVAKGVMLVLAAKAWQAYTAQRAAGGTAPAHASAPAAGGISSFGTGGLLGGLAGMIGGLGGAGALSGLMRQFELTGYGEHARSWIGSGDNEPIQPEQVETVLGGQTLNELAKRFQIPIDQLKSELASALPDAVDQLTPRGKLPSDAELAKL
jgi:uncharacterized protein YidB (DUF937 family)